MWLLPSRGRPESCQLALDAFAENGTTPGVLYVHDTFEEYESIRLPLGWMKYEGEGAQASQMRWLFETYPDEPWYGWIADDNRPRTLNFDQKLADTASNKYFVFCNGGAHKTIQNYTGGIPGTIPSAMVWGGDLVRKVGWWAPPWITHTTIDEHWKYITLRAHKIKYRHDVVIEHLHWRTGGREQDGTDLAWTPYFERDMQAFQRHMAEINRIADSLRTLK